MREYKKNKNIRPVVDSRIHFFSMLIYLCFFILLIYLGYIIVFKHNYYSKLLSAMTSDVYEYKSAPRGRIYDRNYNLLVDNKEIPIISYLKPDNISAVDEIEIARSVAKLIDVNYSRLTLRMLKDYWLVINSSISNDLINSEEWEKYNNRKLNNADIYYLKLSRIDESFFEEYSSIDKETAYIYYLMNNGYSYEEKTIKKDDVTDKEIALITDNLESLKGFYIKYDFERVYLYGDVFKSILGNVSSISKEDKNYYLARGYSLNDMVGVSYIEKQYEELLRGVKGTYRINDGEIVNVSNGKRGKDIVLTIDIKLQQEIEKILEEEIKKTKSEPSTSLFNHAYVVIKDPNNGEVLAMAGKQVIKKNGEYIVYDVTPGVLTNPLTPGSVVKGASMIVGYNESAIKIGDVLKDECIKLYSKPKKCSWKTLGKIDDIKALSLSSNVYQFKTAMKVAGFDYRYNGKFYDTEEAFFKYRKTFNEFGLGVKSEIDLPVDGIGNIGRKTDSDMLLNYVIGQYDTYTTMQLSEYISTVASGGIRYRPHLLKEVYESDNKEKLGTLLYNMEKEVINVVNADKKYIERIQKGFREVMVNGLGKGFMGNVDLPCGKTGTSESFLDTDNDGVIDTPTLTNSFVGYYPYDNPKMSIAITFPNLVDSSNANRRSYANKRITKLISNKFFEIYG
ncbi:MAG: penicillin-binding protein 2 [Bacilli bacterium]|nr:penicillin-binding protein 2 [Bacilli bacterium]